MKPATIAFLVIGAAATKLWLVSSPTYSATPSADLVAVDVLNVSGGSASVSVKNLTADRLSSVFLHCTFRDGVGQRIDSAPVLVSNLAPHDTAHQTARMPNDILAARVECNVEHAYRA